MICIMILLWTHDAIRSRGATTRVSTSIHTDITIYNIDYQGIRRALFHPEVNCLGCTRKLVALLFGRH